MDAKKFRQVFVQAESASRDTIDLKRVYVVMVGGNHGDAAMLSQIIYWHLPNRDGSTRLRVRKGGELWLAKTYKDWWAEIAMTERRAKRALPRLAALGFVEVEHHRFDGLRTCHIRILWPEFVRAYNAAEAGLYGEKESPQVPKRYDRKYQNGTTESTKTVRPLTETTTETTNSDVVKGNDLKNSLAEIGFTPKSIKPFLNGKPRAEVEEWLLITEKGHRLGKVQDPPAYLRKALTDDWEVPRWYKDDDRYRQGQFADFWDA